MVSEREKQNRPRCLQGKSLISTDLEIKRAAEIISGVCEELRDDYRKGNSGGGGKCDGDFFSDPTFQHHYLEILCYITYHIVRSSCEFGRLLCCFRQTIIGAAKIFFLFRCIVF